ncbi:hypothetical protein DFQ28_005938 [Apophysomyces sp. BC1034]|nr:hypothetical protein DFQ28_005938 [Apophysomyces sp. BC1034]
MEKDPPIVPITRRQQIHFDTLWEAACQELTRYASKTWTDTAEHDPGVTLLQALAYGVSDLAYRHTLPLVDLLTEKEKPPIFPEKFGPQWALTCTPITDDDYRRALLDLHSDGDDGYFYFRNIQLVKEPDDHRYTYWYNATEHQLQYHPSRVEKKIQVMGGYQLFVEPNREIVGDPDKLGKAQEALNDFLKNHRNLCEQVRDVVDLAPQDLDVQLEVDLEDDCQDATRVMADIYTLVDDWISPKPQRATGDTLLAQGYAIEDIYHGPQLQHGWIITLPPKINYGEQTIDISGLARHLLAVPGIERIQKLAFPDNEWITTVPVEHYPRVWGKKPFETLCQGKSVKLFKRGQRLKAQAADVEKEVKTKAPKLIDNTHCGVQTGRLRDGTYHPASDRIPPCYGLQDPLQEQKKDPQRLHLHQFLLAFEQWLAGGCCQLSSLPQILAFDRYKRNLKGDIWGYRWPFSSGSLLDKIHDGYRAKLKQCIEKINKDYSKELSIINYLLGYFGGQRPPRVLDLDDEKFLRIQQGYLEQFCELNYNRANIRIDQISALHKRIAARLGIDENLFFDPDKIPLDKLPVYLIEYRSLLPLLPNEAPFQGKSPLSVEVVEEEIVDVVKKIVEGIVEITKKVVTKKVEVVEGVVEEFVVEEVVEKVVKKLAEGEVEEFVGEKKYELKLTFDSDSLPGVGELIELRGGDGKINISWASVTKQEGKSIWINVDRNSRLEEAVNDIKKYFHNMECSHCNAWLYDMDYPLKYADKQEGLKGNQKRIQTKLSATVLAAIKGKEEEKVNIAVEIIGETESQAPLNLFQAKVDENTIDVANGCFVAEIEDMSTIAEIDHNASWPGNADKYRWYIQRETIEDRFSFGIGIVLNRDQLLDSQRVTQPNDVAAWVEQIVLEEVPCHITAHIHWIDKDAFEAFGKNYKKWQESQQQAQSDSKPYSPGDEAYGLLEKLSLGRSPDWVDGIGALHITTQEEWDDLTKGSPVEHLWNDKEEKLEQDENGLEQNDVTVDTLTEKIKDLKTHFNAGHIPRQEDFHDLLDLLHQACGALGLKPKATITNIYGDPGEGLTLDRNDILNVWLAENGGLTVNKAPEDQSTEKRLRISLLDKSGIKIKDNKLSVDEGDAIQIDLNGKTSVKYGKGITLDQEDNKKLIADVKENSGLDCSSGKGITIKTVEGAALYIDKINKCLSIDDKKLLSVEAFRNLSSEDLKAIADLLNFGKTANTGRLKVTDVQPGDELGYSVSLSSDGKMLAVGAYKSHNRNGTVYIFKLNEGQKKWEQLNKLDGKEGEWFGNSVSLNKDGTVLAVGAYEHNDAHNKRVGAVYMYKTSDWSPQKIDPPIPLNDWFGSSISLNDKGDILAVGAPGNSATQGKAYIFKNNSDTWEKIGEVESDGGASINDRFGNSVSLNGDGTKLAVGADWEKSDDKPAAGAVYVFSGSGWTDRKKITPAIRSGNDRFGNSVSLSGNGNTLAVGAYWSNEGCNNAGAVYVFSYSSTWLQKNKLTLGETSKTYSAGEKGNSYFGTSVSLSRDGRTLAAGADWWEIITSQDPKTQGKTFKHSIGAVYAYKSSDGQWSEQTPTRKNFTAEDNPTKDNHLFGNCVSLNNDGTVLAIGAYWADDKAGAVYTFDYRES